MKRHRFLVVLLLAAVGLAVVGSSARRAADHQCALDGADVDTPYRVRIEDEQGRSRMFCGIRCAELWLDAYSGRPRAIHVTDEVNGQELPAARATFVRSSVITNAITGNRIHAFADPTEADRHARAARGQVLTGADRPFADY